MTKAQQIIVFGGVFAALLLHHLVLLYGVSKNNREPGTDEGFLSWALYGLKTNLHVIVAWGVVVTIAVGFCVYALAI